MTGAPDINWLNLALGYVLLLIPLAVLFHYRTGLLSVAALAVLRMTAQLLFVGFYLKFIFDLNSPWLNLAWVVIMILIAGATIDRRGNLKHRYFLGPVLAGLFAGVAVTEFVFLLPVLSLDNPLDARFLIPITGMILGNCLSSSIIGMRSFVAGLAANENRYRYSLACGAARSEALAPFIRQALTDAFSPALATMATIGLISLPGMMTGQILGGVEPLIAVKYQIMIMIAIFSGTVITVTVGIALSRRAVLDAWDRVNREVMRT